MSLYADYVRRFPEMDESTLADNILEDGEVDTDNKRNVIRSIRRAKSKMDDLVVYGGSGSNRVVFDGNEYMGFIGQDIVRLTKDEVAGLFRWYTQSGGMTLSLKECAEELYKKFGTLVPEQLLKRIFSCLDLTKSSEPVPPHGYEEMLDRGDEYQEELLRIQAYEQAGKTDYRKLYEKELEKNAEQEKILDSVVDRLSDRSFPDVEPPGSVEGDEYGELGILLGDWHAGLETDNRFSVFNEAVFRERITLLEKKIAKRIKRSNVAYDKLHFILLGDMVDGVRSNMHSDQPIKHCVTGVDQAALAADGLTEIISKLRIRTGADIEVVSMAGNHGRASADRDEDPFMIGDNMVYEMSRRVLEERFDLTWDQENTFFKEHFIQGAHVLVAHGDKMECSPEQFVYTHTAPSEEAIFVAGHLHEFQLEQNATHIRIQNGSLCGPTKFSVNRIAGTTQPSQSIFEIVGGRFTKAEMLRL